MSGHWRDIQVVVQQLNQFSPENENTEHLLDKSNTLQGIKVTDETFVLKTLSGCIQYKSLLDVVVNAFYIRDGKHCLQSERNLYVVVCYLAIFLLEELGLQQFSRIIKSIDTAKICKFLRFFFNTINLNTWIKDEWSCLYESTYVNNWIKPLQRWQPKVQQLIDQLDKKLDKNVVTTSLKTTEPKEFNLTIPDPRPVLIPEVIPQQGKIKSVPANTYKLPRVKQHLEEMKLKNHQKAQKLLLEANTSQFRCAAPKIDCEGHIAEEIPDRVKRFRAQRIKVKTNNAPVKLNAAAILREGVLYQRKVEEELNRTERLLRGAQDPSEFLEWQKQMQKKDLDQQLTAEVCRRLQGKLSYKEAILAQQNLIQEKKKMAVQLRKQKAEMSHQCMERHLQDMKEKEKMVQQVAEVHKNMKQARTKLQKCKRQIAQEVADESQEILQLALKEEEEEFRKRCELIQQIRAIEYVPSLKNKFVDLAQKANHRVFGEMSIVELQERLALLKEAEKRETEKKRDMIIHEKYAKEQFLLNKLEEICMFREQYGRAAALKQEQKKTKIPFYEGVLKNEEVLNLQKKIEEISTESHIRSESLKRTTTPFKERSTGAWKSQKKTQQEDHWKNLEESRQRQFKMLQHGFISRVVAQKMVANEAMKSGTTACILRS
ncbi:cilia- and flagella-associated protein 99 [Pogona vitticeps]